MKVYKKKINNMEVYQMGIVGPEQMRVISRVEDYFIISKYTFYRTVDDEWAADQEEITVYLHGMEIETVDIPTSLMVRWVNFSLDAVYGYLREMGI